MENRAEMFEKLIKGLQNIYGNMLVSILLYGSVARETNTEDSDVDIAVIVKSGNESEMHQRQRAVVNLAVDLDLEYNQVLSIVDIDLEQFVKWEDILPFYRNVKQEGVVLWKAA